MAPLLISGPHAAADVLCLEFDDSRHCLTGADIVQNGAAHRN